MEQHFENIIVMGKSGAGKQPRIDILTENFGLKQLSTGDIFRSYLGLFNKLGFEGDLSRFYDPENKCFIPDDDIKKALGVSMKDNADDIVLGMKARYFVNRGLFVPDNITNALFESAFRAMGYRGAVLDGFPRTLAQARFLKTLADEHGAALDAILLVENDDELIIQRTIGRRICKNCGKVYHIEYNPPPEGGCGGDPDKACDVIQRSDDTEESLIARLAEFRTKALPAIDYLIEQGIPLCRVPGNLPVFSRAAVQASVFSAMRIA